MGDSLALLTFPCSPKELELLFYKTVKDRDGQTTFYPPPKTSANGAGWMILHRLDGREMCDKGSRIQPTDQDLATSSGLPVLKMG